MNTFRSVASSWLRAVARGVVLVVVGCNADDDEVLFGSGGIGGAGGAGDAVDLEIDPFYPVDVADGAAPAPPMGWNSWNEFGCSATKVSADSIMAIGDAMVDSGMRDAGYEYVNIDDCWLEAERAADGTLQPTAGFPNGIEPVAEYAANAVGRPERDQTNGTEAADDGDLITLDGTQYNKGIGVAAGSKLVYRLGQNCSRFTTQAGLDDSAGASASVQFRVMAEGDEELATTDIMGSESPAETIEVDVTGRHRLTLLVTNALDGGYDGADRYAVWADARLECDEP